MHKICGVSKAGEVYTRLKVIERALKQKELENKKEVLFARISAYESMFDFDTAYRYAKAYVKAYPKDANGKKELTFFGDTIIS